MSIAEHMVIYSRPMHAWVRGAVVKGNFVPTAFDSNTHQHSHAQEFDDAVSKAALSYDKLATAFPTGGITSEQGGGGVALALSVFQTLKMAHSSDTPCSRLIVDTGAL